MKMAKGEIEKKETLAPTQKVEKCHRLPFFFCLIWVILMVVYQVILPPFTIPNLLSSLTI